MAFPPADLRLFRHNPGCIRVLGPARRRGDNRQPRAADTSPDGGLSRLAHCRRGTEPAQNNGNSHSADRRRDCHWPAGTASRPAARHAGYPGRIFLGLWPNPGPRAEPGQRHRAAQGQCAHGRAAAHSGHRHF